MDVPGDKPNFGGTSRLCQLIDSSEHTDFDDVLLRIGGLVAKTVDSAPEKPYAFTLGPSSAVLVVGRSSAQCCGLENGSALYHVVHLVRAEQEIF
jgi:hypothetical protein